MTCSSSLFQESWWLEIVAPQQWHELVVENKGQILASWKLVSKRHYGMNWISMPPFTPYLGPTINLTAEKNESKISQEIFLLKELINQLPTFDYFNIRLDPIRQNWLPFYWQGFDQSLVNTYIFHDLYDLDKIWHGMRESTRRQIRKAGKQLEVQKCYEDALLYRMVTNTFERQNYAVPFDETLVYALVQRCKEKNCGQILKALDANENVHAAIFVVWDDRTVYYLAGGSDPNYRSSGAMSLLLWEAVRLAFEKRLKFDFEGSMVKGVERFFRGFGAHPQTIIKITRTDSYLARLANWWIQKKERAMKT